jgi:hypothetical protein
LRQRARPALLKERSIDMKRQFFQILCLIMMVGVLGVASPAWAHWNVGDPAKWVQLPNLDNGVDVQATWPNSLADDFLCTFSGPITDIHLWGSVLGDGDPGLLKIFLGIYSNIPSGPDGYSVPGDFLWGRYFLPGQYTIRDYATGLSETFWDPKTGATGSDTVVKQLNFYIDPQDAFPQVEGTTYWLVVEVADADTGTMPAIPVGWKTSVDQWNDNAVWYDTDPDHRGWYELIYADKSVDLAFAITTVPLPPSAWLLGSGLLGLLGFGWRSRKG